MRVIVSSFGLIEQGAHYKKILDLLDEESVSGESSGRGSLIEVLPRMFEKVSQTLKYHSKYFFVHKQTYIFIT